MGIWGKKKWSQVNLDNHRAPVFLDLIISWEMVSVFTFICVLLNQFIFSLRLLYISPIFFRFTPRQFPHHYL